MERGRITHLLEMRSPNQSIGIIFVCNPRENRSNSQFLDTLLGKLFAQGFQRNCRPDALQAFDVLFGGCFSAAAFRRLVVATHGGGSQKDAQTEYERPIQKFTHEPFSSVEKRVAVKRLPTVRLIAYGSLESRF